MKYEYCGISLGDDIKDIISKFNISKIKMVSTGIDTILLFLFYHFF